MKNQRGESADFPDLEPLYGFDSDFFMNSVQVIGINIVFNKDDDSYVEN